MASNPIDGIGRSIVIDKEDYDDATELVNAVKSLNRSVASLNRALIKLQDKIVNQCTSTNNDCQRDIPPKTLH